MKAEKVGCKALRRGNFCGYTKWQYMHGQKQGVSPGVHGCKERTGTYPWHASRQSLCTGNIAAILDQLVQQNITPVQTNSQEKQAILDLATVRKYDTLLFAVYTVQLNIQYIYCCMEALQQQCVIKSWLICQASGTQALTYCVDRRPCDQLTVSTSDH